MNKQLNITLRRILGFGLLLAFALPVSGQEFFYHTGFKTSSLEISAFEFIKGGKEVLVAEGNAISRYVVRTGKVLEGLPVEHSGRIMALDISKDGQLLVSGGDDGRIILWDPSANEKISEIGDFPGMVTDLKLSPDKALLLAGSRDGKAILYALAGQKMVQEFSDHEKDVSDVEFSPDGSLFATAGGDGSICLYKTSTGERVATLEGHKSWVRDVEFSAQGNRLFSCGDDIYIIEWDVSEPGAASEISRTKQGHSWITSIDLHPTDDTYATGNLMGVCRITTPFELAHAKSRAPVNQVSFVPGKLNFYRIMVATEGNGLQIFDARDMKHRE